MTATVIDELVVILGLDPSKMTEGQKKVADNYLRLKSDAERANKEMQRSTESVASALGQVQGKLLGIAALFLGGMGIKQFAMHVADLTLQLGRLSTQAGGLSSSQLSAYGSFGRAVGATAAGVRSGVLGLAAAGNQVEPNTQLYQTLAAMGISPRRLPNGDFDVNGTLGAVNQWAAQRRARGWGEGRISGMLRRLPGMNDDLLSVVNQPPAKFQEMLHEMQKFGPTPEQVKAIQQVNEAWALLQTKMEATARIIETQLAPVLTKIIDIAGKFFDSLDNRAKKYDSPQDAAKALHDKLGEGVGASPESPWSRWMKGLGKWWSGTGNLTDDSAHASTPPQQPGVNGAPAAGNINIPTTGIDRSRFKTELDRDPALREKVLRIAANEQGSNPQGTQAIIESMMNRAEMRGTTLRAQARWHRSEGGYYDEGNMGRGALENPKQAAILRRALDNALGGGNVANYATDNASGDLATRERANGKFKFRNYIHGETFFSPGWGGGAFGPSSEASYDAWRAKVAANDKIWQTHGGIFLGQKARDLNVMGNSTASSSSTTTNQTHVGEVNVHVPNGDPYSIAKGIHGALVNVAPVVQSNTGPW